MKKRGRNVQFVGTGVWDNEAFFNEPSLQGSIFPGVPQSKRKQYFSDYYLQYGEQPTRTITIPYDLIGILEYIIKNKLNLKEVHQLLDSDQSKIYVAKANQSTENDV